MAQIRFPCIFLLCSVIFQNQAHSQLLQWEKTFGGEQLDIGNSVQPTSDGGYIVAGWTDSFGAGDRDFYLIKLDAEGNLDPAWPENPKTFGGPKQDTAFSAEQTSDGGYIVAGWTESFGAGKKDAYLIKLTPEGNLDPAWPENPKTFGGPAKDTVFVIQQTSDGGYVAAGGTESVGVGREDVYLLKLDSRGNLDPAWAENPRTFGGEDTDWTVSLQQTSDGGYILAGGTASTGAGEFDIYVLKVDSKGDLDAAWPENPRTFGGQEDDWSYSVRQTSDGGYIVAGWTFSFGAGGTDIYLIKLDSWGHLDPAWPENPKTFGGEAFDWVYSIQQTSEGGYIIAGWTESSGAGGQDVYLIKLDSRGNFDPAWPENPRTFGGQETDAAHFVRQTSDGGYIVASWTSSFGAGAFDVYLIKLAPEPRNTSPFLRGDCNGDGNVAGEVADAIFLLGFNFLGDPQTVSCLAACDADGDGDVAGQITDAVYLITFNFLSGPAPVEPYPNCSAGGLATDKDLGCETPPQNCP